jgi:hypothetical protein
MRSLVIVFFSALLVACACANHTGGSGPRTPPPTPDDSQIHEAQASVLSGVLNASDVTAVEEGDEDLVEGDDAEWLKTVEADNDDNIQPSEAEPPPPKTVAAMNDTRPCLPTIGPHFNDRAQSADRTFAEFTDCNNLLEPGKYPSISTGAGNGVLFTSEELAFYAEQGWANDNDRLRLIGIINKLKVSDGLINRNPGIHPYENSPHEEQEGADDYVGLVAAAHMLGGSAQSIAHQVWEYGNKNAWTYQNTPRDAGLHAFLGRPWFVAHFSYCAGEAADPISETAWGTKMALGARKGHASDVALEWLMIHCLPMSAGATAKAGAALWVHKFKNNWPGGIGQVMEAYFQTKDHPLVRCAPTDDFTEFQGVRVIFGAIIDMFRNLGLAAYRTSVLIVRDGAHQIAVRTWVAVNLVKAGFVELDGMARDAARAVETKLASAERRLSPKKLEHALEKGAPLLEHPIEIVVKDAPKDLARPVEVAVRHLDNGGKTIVRDVRTWVHHCWRRHC